MPTVAEINGPGLTPPGPGICCVPGSPFALGVPMEPNMQYFGGHVQVTPKIYLVLLLQVNKKLIYILKAYKKSQIRLKSVWLHFLPTGL